MNIKANIPLAAAKWLTLLLSLACGHGAEAPRTVPTFHCMSLYWPREDGAFTNRCEVRYRVAGAADWREGHELWWDATHKFYAGAVVGLKSGTACEFELKLAASATTRLTGRTWADEFPVARVVKLAPGTLTQPLIITEGGSAASYIVYGRTRRERRLMPTPVAATRPMRRNTASSLMRTSSSCAA